MSSSIGHYERVRALAATNRFFVTAGHTDTDTSEVVVYVRSSGKHQTFWSVKSQVNSLVLVKDELAVVGCSDGTVRANQLTDGKSAGEWKAHDGSVNSVAMSTDSSRVYSVGADGHLRVFLLSDRKEQKHWKLSTQPLRAVAMDPTGEFVAAAGDDSNVYVITVATGAVRTMSGHTGAVFSLEFTKLDGRLASGGEDGTVRFWYTVGATDAEVRGADDSGHVGGVTAIRFLPTWETPPPGVEVTERFVTTGMDGTIKVWLLESRRKPRTIDLSNSKPLYGLAVVPAKDKAHQNASDAAAGNGIIAAGDSRTVYFCGTLLDGSVSGYDSAFGHAFDVLAANLLGVSSVREKAIQTLAAREEEEARPLLLRVLSSDSDANLRALTTRLLGEKNRRWARSALVERLNDDSSVVRANALAALRTLDGANALAPLRFALASRFADVRADATKYLAALSSTTPVAEGLIIDRLKDAAESVRRVAFFELCAIYPADSATPLQIGFDRGAEDIQIEALIRGAQAGLSSKLPFSAILARGLDDGAAEVRRIAFALQVHEKQALFAAIKEDNDDLERTLQEVARRIAVRTRETAKATDAANKAVSKEEIALALSSLKTSGDASKPPTERELEPLLTALACRMPDTALRGARGLARMGDVRALGALLQLSRESDAVLRREAAAALRALEDPRAKKRLVWMFDDTDPSVRAAALDAYGKLESRNHLLVAEAALRSAHEDIRVRGLDRLVKLGAAEKKREQPAEALLGDALEDEAEKVRAEAFRTLWSWHSDDPVKALDRALQGRFADLRLRAVQELVTKAKEEWALERLVKAISDRDEAVAKAAFDAVIAARKKGDPDACIRSMESVVVARRVAGAHEARHAKLESVRSALTQLLQDEHEAVRGEALETLDRLLGSDHGPLYAALQSSYFDLKVRAAAKLAARKDEQIIEPMRSLLLDKELYHRFQKPVVDAWRTAATEALATLGSSRCIKLFSAELLKDDVATVREAAARGLAVCCRRGDESYLLDALSHADVGVRSWAADGLARLGDVRALPVLTGNLKHPQLTIRIGAILSFAALGPEGYGGMLQGLEDSDRDVQERVFAIVLARDLRALRRGEAPDLLTSALSSQRPDVRFSAARALELRTTPEEYLSHIIEVLQPPRPEKASEMKSWPIEEVRGRVLVGLADALASDLPEQRYAAAQVLNHRQKPTDYFTKARDAGAMRSLSKPWVADNRLPKIGDNDIKPEKGWLRKLFVEELVESTAATAEKTADRASLIRLAFGAYVGLLRQVVSDEESQRVRRDAVDRIVALASEPSIGVGAALPAVIRAIDDNHHLVRKSSLAGLKKLYSAEPNTALELALASQHGDIARAALDELAAQGSSAFHRVARAVNAPVAEVRKYAFELLEKLAPKNSLDPLVAALGSTYSDLRLGVIGRLAQSADPRVTEALLRALSSEHDDLRLRAAEMLAWRKDVRAAEVLANFMRHDNADYASRAGTAVIALDGAVVVPILAGRLEEVAEGSRHALLSLVAAIRTDGAADLAISQFAVNDSSVRSSAFQAAIATAYVKTDKQGKLHYDPQRILRVASAAARAKDPELRLSAIRQLEELELAGANDVLFSLFTDRDVPVRVAAVTAYGARVIAKRAPVEPLTAVLTAGARELVLGAAEGVASTGDSLALRPLLLVVRAGQPEERPRALLALGTLGDPRALGELEVVANGGTEEAPVDQPMQAAAIEAMGRLYPKLTDADARKRVLERLEQTLLDGSSTAFRESAAKGLFYIGGEIARLRLENALLASWQDYRVRNLAAERLAALGDTQAEQALVQSLKEYDVAEAARTALYKLFANDRVRIEFYCLDSGNDEFATNAVNFLAAEGDVGMLLTRLTERISDEHRATLRIGIIKRGTIPVEAAIKVLGDSNPITRAATAQIIGTLADGTDSATRTALATAIEKALQIAQARFEAGTPAPQKPTDDDDYYDDDGEQKSPMAPEIAAWRQSLWAARRLGAHNVLSKARALLMQEQPAVPAEVRLEALQWVVAANQPQDLATLERALKDASAAVRGVAVDALVQRDPDKSIAMVLATEPFDPVNFARAAKTPAIRAQLLKQPKGRKLALAGAIVNGEVDELIQLATLSADPTIRLEACTALGRAGGARAKETLALIAKDKKGANVELRKTAYCALKRAVRTEKKAIKHQQRPQVTLAKPVEGSR
jgi:ParB family chromosome partitioning protein